MHAKSGHVRSAIRKLRQGHRNIRTGKVYIPCYPFSKKQLFNISELKYFHKYFYACGSNIFHFGKLQVAASSLETSLLKYSAKEYFFRAALCHLCVDCLNAQHAVQRYEEQYPAFSDSREAK